MNRLVIALIVMLFASTSSFAQASFSITLSEQELNLIGKALGKMPYEEVAKLMAAVQTQVNEQQAAEATRLRKIGELEKKQKEEQQEKK